MQPMYEASANSPHTTLTADIDDITTTIPVYDTSVLPPPPNIVVIGYTSAVGETVLYESIGENTLMNCIRGFQGTARSWPSTTKVARVFTAYDHNTFIANINALNVRFDEYTPGSGDTSVVDGGTP